MKKKFIILLIAVAILVSISSISLVLAAGNAYVTFSGPSLIRPGKTYTYNYTLHVNNACAANANISVGGAFEKVSGGENLFYDTIPKNTTGTVSGSVTVRVKSNANPGDAGIISVIEDESKCSELQFDSSGKVKGDPIITTVTGSISVPVTFSPTVTATPGDGCVTLSWKPVPGATKYAIAYWKNNGWVTLTYNCTDTSYTVTDLVSGRSYTFLVQAYVDGKWSKFDSTDYVSATPTGPTKPAPKVTTVGDGSVTLSWNKISGATKYAIAYLNNSGAWTTLTYNCTDTSYTATGLINRKEYTFLVQAYLEDRWSSYTSADFVKATPQDPNRPVVKATPGKGSVTLSWNPVSGATAYAVAYYKNGWVTLTYDCTDTSYTVTDLVSGRSYTFLVQAKVDGKWSKYDSTDYVSATPTGPTKPAPKVTAVGDGSVTLSWERVSAATAYAIAYLNNSGKWTTLTYDCTDTTYTITDLVSGKTYTFLVQAKVDGKWSKFDSTDYVYATPTGPTKPAPKVTAVGDGSVTLSWNKISGATKYAIAYLNSSGGWTTLTYNCAGTTYTATGLTNRKLYIFLVQSYADGKWSSFSSADYVKGTPQDPNRPVVKATPGHGSVTLSWNPVSGATAYAVAYYK
ncbi:MAG: fibronectin type III domain-containing protein, partial [Christensenellales bacterium]